MAPFHCVSLVISLLFITGAHSDVSTTNHHQHHGSSHHHRNPGAVNWSPRHNAHTAQYPHSRHNNHHVDSSYRDTRLRSLFRASTTTVSSVSKNNSNSLKSSYARSKDDKLSAALLVEPISSRSSYSAVVHQQNFYQTTTPANVYNKFQPGRRVCSRTSEASSSLPHHHRSRQPRLAYTDLPSGFLCCPGWTQVTRLSFGCNKPVCSLPCQNGGVCSSPGRCTCPKGFIGNYCQIDVDECVTEKPCDQICRNVPGTYECYCRSGYELQPDRTSCRKNDSDGTALEARDLELDYEETTTTSTRRPILRDTENEVGDEVEESSYEELLRRLIKLEKQLAKGKKREAEANEITTRIASAIDSINEIRRSIQHMQLMQQEIYELRNKVKLYEYEARKIQHLSSRVMELENRIRLRCRSSVYLKK